MKKIFNVVLTLIIVLSFLVIGFFIGYIQKKPESYKPTTTSELTLFTSTPTPITFLPLKTLKVNGFDFSFEYQPTWQILANGLIEDGNGFSKKSIAINLDKPHIIGNFGFMADIMIIMIEDSLPRKSLTNIDDFIKVTADEEVGRSSFYNKNSVQIIKLEDKNELRGRIITSHYFQYKDSNEKKHFVYLYTLTLNNEAVLKAIDIIINSLKINSL